METALTRSDERELAEFENNARSNVVWFFERVGAEKAGAEGLGRAEPIAPTSDLARIKDCAAVYQGTYGFAVAWQRMYESTNIQDSDPNVMAETEDWATAYERMRELAAACQRMYEPAEPHDSDVHVLHVCGEREPLTNWSWNKALPALPSLTKPDIPKDCKIELAVRGFVETHLAKESLFHAIELAHTVFTDRESMAANLHVDPEIEEYCVIVIEVCTRVEMSVALDLEEIWHERLVREFPPATAQFFCLNVVLV